MKQIKQLLMDSCFCSFSFFFTIMVSAVFILPSSCLSADNHKDSDFARYRDYGHLSGLIGNYLSKPRTPVKMSTTCGRYHLTFYWISREADYNAPKTEHILIVSKATGEENPTEVSKEFKEHLDREGTGILEDGRLINVMNRKDRKRYLDISTTYPTGLGCRNNMLTPFISVAVSDRNKDLKFGDSIYIPDVKGTPLPDGGVHDGIFSVDDTGKGIATNQIDIFVFIKSNWQGFQNHLKTHRKKFFVYKIYYDGQ